MQVRFVACVTLILLVLGCQDEQQGDKMYKSAPLPRNVQWQSQVIPECYRFDSHLGDARVISAPPVEQPRPLHRFDFETDHTPWAVADGNGRCSVKDNALVVETDTSTKCDSPEIQDVPASHLGAILIRARSANCSQFKFAWRGEKAEFLNENEVSIDLASSGEWTLYQLDTDGIRGFHSDLGNVGQLRLIVPGKAKLEVRSVVLARSVDLFAGQSSGQTDYPAKARRWVHSVFGRTPCSLEYSVTVMPRARLSTTFLLPDRIPAQFRILLMDGAERSTLAEAQVGQEDASHEVAVDLSRWAGKEVRICFEAESQEPGRVVLWCNPVLERIYPVTESKRPLNVVWYVIDCLRAPNVGAYGYERNTTPTIDAVAREGTRFEWCFSPGTWTIDSVSSFLTGLSPNAHGILRRNAAFPDSMRTLPEVLRNFGYSTGMYSQNPYLEDSFGFMRGFDEVERLRVRSPRMKAGTADTYPINVAIGKFLKENRENPFFLYVHTIEPHRPTIPPASLRVFAHPDGSVGEMDLYDDCVYWADANLAHTIGELKELGLWNNTLLIVTADHGQAFREYDNGLDGHGDEPYLSRVRIPLIMRLPGTIPAGLVVEENVQGLDIPQTIFELLQIPPDPQFDGWSLLGLLDGSRKAEFAQRKLFPSGQLTKWQAVVDGKWYFHDNDGKLELYDLATDPAAKTNVSAEHPDIAQMLLTESQKYREAELQKAEAYPTKSVVVEMSQESQEELEALGYMK